MQDNGGNGQTVYTCKRLPRYRSLIQTKPSSYSQGLHWLPSQKTVLEVGYLEGRLKTLYRPKG
jgi:hypothetical protein